MEKPTINGDFHSVKLPEATASGVKVLACSNTSAIFAVPFSATTWAADTMGELNVLIPMPWDLQKGYLLVETDAMCNVQKYLRMAHFPYLSISVTPQIKQL